MMNLPMALVAERVDATDLKSVSLNESTGSSPVEGTTLRDGLDIWNKLQAQHFDCWELVGKILKRLEDIKKLVSTYGHDKNLIEEINERISLLATSSLRVEESFVGIEADMDAVKELLNRAFAAQVDWQNAKDYSNDNTETVHLKVDTNGTNDGYDLLITILGFNTIEGRYPKKLIKSLGEEDKKSAHYTAARAWMGKHILEELEKEDEIAVEIIIKRTNT